MKKAGFIAWLALLATEAQAHPDHAGESAAGLSHLVTDPFHLSLIALAVGLAVGARLMLRRFSR